MSASDRSPPLTARAPAPLSGGGGDGWTVLVPSAVASQWTLVTLAPDRAGTQVEVGTSTAGTSTGASMGIAGDRVGDNQLPEIAVNMAAALDVASFTPSLVGSGTGGGGPFVPIIFIHTGHGGTESGKADVQRVLKAIFGAFLFGPIAIIKPLNDIISPKYDNTAVWTTFGSYWVVLSIIFHATIRGNVPDVLRPWIQGAAPFILTFFGYMVILYLYVLIPSTKASQNWFQMMMLLLLIGHCIVGLIWGKNSLGVRAASFVRNYLEQSPLMQNVAAGARLKLAKVKRWWARVRARPRQIPN